MKTKDITIKELDISKVKDFFISMSLGGIVRIAIASDDGPQVIVCTIVEGIEFLSKWHTETVARMLEDRIKSDGFR